MTDEVAIKRRRSLAEPINIVFPGQRYPTLYFCWTYTYATWRSLWYSFQRLYDPDISNRTDVNIWLRPCAWHTTLEARYTEEPMCWISVKESHVTCTPQKSYNSPIHLKLNPYTNTLFDINSEAKNMHLFANTYERRIWQYRILNPGHKVKSDEWLNINVSYRCN